jgi:RNA polymerase sigma-70 factor (ECF subfamily)
MDLRKVEMITAKSERTQNDQRIKDGLLKGDESVLAEFYERFFPHLYRYIYYRVGRDHHHAEEVVHDTLVEALEKIERFEPELGSLESWLITTSRNRIRSLNNSLGRARSRETSWGMLEGELDTIFADLAQENEQHAAIERDDLKNLVGLVMGSLPEDYSKMLEMKYIDDMSTREMANAMDKTEKAVESKLTRARAAFRDLFTSATANMQV